VPVGDVVTAENADQTSHGHVEVTCGGQ